MSGHRVGGLRLFRKDTGEPVVTCGDIQRLHAEKLLEEYKKTTLTPFFRPMCTTYELKVPATREERFERAVALKSRGNHAFGVKSFAEARHFYEQAKALIIPHELTALDLDILVAVHSNLAQCALRLVAERKVGQREALHRAVCDCTQALELQPMHTKARFHRAKALIQLGALDAARTDIGKLEGAEREARMSAAEMQLLQELLAKAVGASQIKFRVLQLDDLGDLLHDLQTTRGREKWGFLSQDPDTVDTILRDVGFGCPSEEVGRLFWEACVLLPVDQQLVLLKALRKDWWCYSRHSWPRHRSKFRASPRCHNLLSCFTRCSRLTARVNLSLR